jgi:hypothetical protein
MKAADDKETKPLYSSRTFISMEEERQDMERSNEEWDTEHVRRADEGAHWS